MKTNFKIFTYLLTILFILNLPANDSPVNAQSQSNKVYLPFLNINRTSYAALISRMTDGFGAYRRYGHLHAGLDIKGQLNEKVYAIGRGKVIAQWYSFPNLAVVIEHTLEDGSSIYASYVHLGEVYVQEGDRVDQNTVLGRLFNKEEQQRSGWQAIHLHLEIRKTLKDQGKASYSCHSLEELHHYFYDPLIWFKKRLDQ